MTMNDIINFMHIHPIYFAGAVLLTIIILIFLLKIGGVESVMDIFDDLID